MNAKQVAIFERNQALYQRFQELDAKEDVTAAEWEILAGHYLEAGYYSNASVCFERANKIKEKRIERIGTYKMSNRRLLEIVGAPWDEMANAEA